MLSVLDGSHLHCCYRYRAVTVPVNSGKRLDSARCVTVRVWWMTCCVKGPGALLSAVLPLQRHLPLQLKRVKTVAGIYLLKVDNT